MKKKGIVSVMVVIVVLGVLLSIYNISSTYAKYAENFLGTSSTAQIAKWDVTVGDLDNDKVFTFDLFSASKIMAHNADFNYFTCLAGNPSNANECTGVGKVQNTKVDYGFIAPGTAGKYQFTIKNQSDVKYRVADVNVTGVDGTNNRIRFCFLNDCENGIAGLNTLLKKDFVNNKAQKPDNSVYTIWWYWEFESSDENNELDTKVGKEAKENGAIVQLSIAITLEQVPIS